MSSRRPRAFTLVEMLVAIGIVGILAGILLPTLRKTRQRAHVTTARAQLQMIATALAAYDADYRALPRTTGTGRAEEVLRDDGPALYAALQNAPTPALGGGRNAPYLKAWSGEVGHLRRRSYLEPGSMGEDGDAGAVLVEPFQEGLLSDPDFQAAHGPRSPTPLVLLDPWGNPWHYRSWRGVPARLEEAIAAAPPRRSGFGPPVGGGDPPVDGPVEDLPHDRYGYDVWSNGPNGINEYGAEGSDDVCSWRAP